MAKVPTNLNAYVPSGMIEMWVTVSNFYKARDAIWMINQTGIWKGMFKRYISHLLRKGTRYAKQITPKVTGELSRAHMWDYDSHRMRGNIFINPRAVWLEGQSTIRWPKVYGVYVHARGGASAFYERTSQWLKNQVPAGLRAAVRELPWP